MTRARGTAWLLVAAFTALGCGQASSSSSAPPPAGSGLSAGMVARVGGRSIAATSVGRIAAAQKIEPAAARDLAVRDALLAEGAAAEGLDRSLDVTLSARAMLARRLLRVLRVEAERVEITSDELAAATARRWLDVDRPEGFRTVHAVVRFDASAPEDKRKEALEVAEMIRMVALPLTEKAARLPPSPGREDPLVSAFQQAIAPVIAAARDGEQVTAGPLSEVAEDGRVLAPGGETYELSFAKAAAALGRRGEISPVTVSSFGAHVIMLLERTPAERMPLEERRRFLREDIMTARVRAAEEKILVELRKKSAPERDADALLALCPVDL